MPAAANIVLKVPLGGASLGAGRDFVATAKARLQVEVTLQAVMGGPTFSLSVNDQERWSGQRLDADKLLEVLAEATGSKVSAPEEVPSVPRRSFDACVKTMQGLVPDRPLKEQTEAAREAGHLPVSVVRALAFGDLSDWPSSPPTPSLYLTKRPPSAMADGQALFKGSNFGAIGAWNAQVEGQWCGRPEQWIIAQASLSSEQQDDADEGGGSVELLLAAWTVEEGTAVAVLTPRGRASLPSIMGLGDWPASGWKPFRAWHGE